jgi:6-phosphogluconolactonase
MEPELIVIKNKDLFYNEICKHIEKTSKESIKRSDRFTIALSGGNTPKELFNILSKPPFVKSIDWEKTYLFQVDERCVALDDENRNYKMIYQYLIEPLQIPINNLHLLQSDLSQPEKAVINYENEIKTFFKNEYPSFDLILLGIGEDGHTASLFPDDKKSIENKNKLIITTFSNITKPNVARVTMTLNLINSSKNAFFIAAGENKRKIIKEILSKNSNYPASLVNPLEKILIFYDIDID